MIDWRPVIRAVDGTTRHVSLLDTARETGSFCTDYTMKILLTLFHDAIAITPSIQLSFSNREKHREHRHSHGENLARLSRSFYAYILTCILSLPPSSVLARGLNAEVAPPRVDIAQVDLHGQPVPRVVHLG